MANPTEQRRPDSPPAGTDTDKNKDKTLDTSLEDTFPASDPPASGNPTKTVGWEEPEPEAPAKR